jgi:hypothetical protein
MDIAMTGTVAGFSNLDDIGIILCRSKGKTTVEYALRDLQKPIGVSTHKLPKTLKVAPKKV